MHGSISLQYLVVTRGHRVKIVKTDYQNKETTFGLTLLTCCMLYKHAKRIARHVVLSEQFLRIFMKLRENIEEMFLR